MPAGCQFTFSYSASIRRLPTWEEAESCNGNMMLLSASFSSFYPLLMSHPYLLMSGSLAWGLISALCRLLHDMKHSARTTTTSQRKLLPLRPTRDERSAHDFEKSSAVSSWAITAVTNLREQRGEDFFKENWSLWGSFHRKLFFDFFSIKWEWNIVQKMVREHESVMADPDLLWNNSLQDRNLHFQEYIYV